MPTKRTRRTHARRVDFTSAHQLQLCCGYDFFRDAYGEGEDFDRELAERHWFEHRQEIIEAHRIRRPKDSLPWAYYEFEEKATDDPHDDGVNIEPAPRFRDPQQNRQMIKPPDET